jgi:predicted transcriptional regulator
MLEKKTEKQEKLQEKQAAMREAFNGDGTMSAAFINELLSHRDIDIGEPRHPDDDDDSPLQAQTVAKLQNMLSRDWVLSNLTGAQEHDIRWKLEVMRLKIIGMHPPQGSAITGATRAFLMDDEMEELNPLTQQERLLVDELMESLKARITRGRDGFEREQMNTTIAETRNQQENGGESESGGLGFFG